MCGKPPKQRLRGSFCFLLHYAVNHLTGFSIVLQNFLEILLHNGKTPFFHLAARARCRGKWEIPQLLHNTVVQVAGLGEILHDFSKILLHKGKAPFISFDSQSPLPGQMGSGSIKDRRQCDRCRQHWPGPASSRNCSSSGQLLSMDGRQCLCRAFYMGYGSVYAVILYKIHAAQSDGLANGLHQVLHGFISFTFYARRDAGVACFLLACQPISARIRPQHTAMQRHGIDGVNDTGGI